MFASGIVEILPPETTELLNPAETARENIERLLDEIRDSEFGLAANYARLGASLFEARRNQYWESWGYSSWGSYIRELAERVRKERSQMYAYIGVAETLLPMVDEETLVAIGISKAGELRKFVKQSGRRIPEPLLAKALDDKTTVKELRAAVFEEMHQAPDPAARWYDLGGFFATTEERLQIEQAIQKAKTEDPPIDNSLPEHVQRKEVFLRFAQEFMSAYPN